ncbi:STM2901 family protein [Dryocola sp. LX212]
MPQQSAFLDKIDEQFGGITDVIAMSSTILGLPLPKTRGKPYGATPGTPIASSSLRQALDTELPMRLATLTHGSIERLKSKYVTNLEAFIGRWVPVVGWGMLAGDVAQIVFEAVNTYNMIARKEDRIG